jgi:hypothetical protein
MLSRKGHVFPYNWSARQIVLTDEKLERFDIKSEASKGSLVFGPAFGPGIGSVRASSEPNEFIVVCGDKNTRFKAASATEQAEWVDAIQQCIDQAAAAAAAKQVKQLFRICGMAEGSFNVALPRGALVDDLRAAIGEKHGIANARHAVLVFVAGEHDPLAGTRPVAACMAEASVSELFMLVKVCTVRECLLCSISHPNICSHYAFSDDSCPHHCPLLELCTGKSLTDRLQVVPGQEALTWEHRLRIMLGISKALAHLHSSDPPILHLNVNSASVLLDGAGEAKLTDFGSAREGATVAGGVTVVTQNVAGEGNVTYFGAKYAGRRYMPPEYVTMGHVSEKTDSYAFGVVLLELVTGKPPRAVVDLHARENHIFEHICSGELVDSSAGAWPPSVLRDVADIAKGCLTFHSRHRRSVREVHAARTACLARPAHAARSIWHAVLAQLWSLPCSCAPSLLYRFAVFADNTHTTIVRRWWDS